MDDLSVEQDSFVAECLQNIVQGRISEARSMLASQSDGLEERAAGRRLALNGLIEVYRSKSNIRDLGGNGDTDGVKEVMLFRMKSIWCDEFDRGYYEVWLRFFDMNRNQGQGGRGGSGGWV